MRIQVYAGVEEGLRQAVDPPACVLERQVMGDLLGLMGCELHAKFDGDRGGQCESSILINKLIFSERLKHLV